MSRVYEADLAVDAGRGNTAAAMRTTNRLFSPLVAICLATAWLGCQGYREYYPASAGNTGPRDYFGDDEESSGYGEPRAALVKRAAFEEQTPSELHDETLEFGSDTQPKSTWKQVKEKRSHTIH